MLSRTHYTDEISKVVDGVVVLNGWVHDIRRLGGIAFIILRDAKGYAQVTVIKKESPGRVTEVLEELRQEDVVAIKGKVVAAPNTAGGIEVVPQEIEVQNRSAVPLPLDPRGVVPTTLTTQQDWRFLHFRSERGRAIFKIQSLVANALRTYFVENGYMEIQPPVLIGAASEGGAELFTLDYFGKRAYLAQSPQLHKQMCAIAFEKVFCVVPVFRAEKFEQPTHLNEIRQVDIEQAFATHEDVMKVLEECLNYVIGVVSAKGSKELEVLKHTPPIPTLPLPRVTYTNAIEALQKAGESIAWGDDFSKTQEQVLAKEFGTFFFLTEWPTKARAFFAMPNERNPELCNAFDLEFDGLEIASGTQRIHIPQLLTQQIASRGMNPKQFEFYIDAFKYGAPIHSGWSIGLERLTMKICGAQNLREATFFPRDRNRLTP